MAVRARRPGAGLVHHTDRGGQYTATAYQSQFAARGVICSMSRAGECLDNAMAESFFATLKAELVAAHRWPTRAAARTAIFEWIEAFYNRQRAHSALAYTVRASAATSTPGKPTGDLPAGELRGQIASVPTTMP
jgi:putative transposase